MNALKGKRKRRERLSAYGKTHLEDHHFFSLMVAAYVNNRNPCSEFLIKSLLKAQLARIRQNCDSREDVLSKSILSLLPVLLSSRFTKIAATAAEIVGAAGLSSLESNERITSDKAIMDSLVCAMSCPAKLVSLAVVNAILDLSTTSVGREHLWRSAAVEKMISLFCQVASSSPVNFLAMREGTRSINCFKRRFMEEELLVVVLDSLSKLINSCSLHHLAKIPRNLADSFLVYLDALWAQLGDSFLQFNFKSHDLAEAIFRLSMNHENHSSHIYAEVKKRIFGTESKFESFMFNNWEEEPFLVKYDTELLEDNDCILNSLTECFRDKTIDSILSSILIGSVSCPPIASDELNIIEFLKEVKGLGSSIRYERDIRVVKTMKLPCDVKHGLADKEVHYISGCREESVVSLEKCKAAYNEGYTITVRGMEFRSEKIASIALALAKVFGQPSVGANIYLTPPQSQGLSRHYDDHCVFVCQLVGSKKWTIFSQEKVLLPRLYEPLSLHGLEVNGHQCARREFLLEEGDILYIPRGYPHEAHTVLFENESSSDASAAFSLHLTVGIEVEPPFLWEGFVHISIQCWHQKLKAATRPMEHPQIVPKIAYVYMLHVSIKLIADHDSAFRKACMVASIPSEGMGGKKPEFAISVQHKAIFSHLIAKVNSDSNFWNALTSVEAALKENLDDPCEWMKWIVNLDFLDGTESEMSPINWLKAFKDLVFFCKGHMEAAESEFAMMKMEFCRNVVFEDACKSFRMLLGKYKKTREQYMRGMLALHRNKRDRCRTLPKQQRKD
ncbi:hypothetical protein H6P81_011369 [Aristolochia fimbriata]|uniref:Bifunctional lysine-specific demethylase and histidyl-hydroxylase n=1 Tax=Aristolochia fimbriata TaxID=158543 RepID=A0AAV7ESL6_ARIFI|nr:hypothetical protein H6P81_011369 [Aristolochia fimbriata]